ncbi:hypothetical protein RvY_06006 [Ramazzottius varieornatus]|uniref:protein-tyrosine-phosphatase n=1 Tax=Ramazzottius varieornatus TaxID=947166 RepID=A0A1D1UXI6_RAMVA|nr:hypothetical protein RvY_06006 [Ramazzottius varieornatus]
MQCFGIFHHENPDSFPKLRTLKKMSIEAQYESFEHDNSWGKLYNTLRTKSEKQTSELSTSEAKKPDNKPRNRFRDVFPFDQSRVHLQPCLKISSDYINASIVKFSDARRSYICSQSPLSPTVGHLWEMLWTQKCTTIVMLNNLLEKGMPTCATYYPSEAESSLTFEDSDHCHEYIVTLVKEAAVPVFATRWLKVVRRKREGDDSSPPEERQITQFHFTNWPDFGVPTCPDEFLDFLFAVRQSGCFDVKPNKQECDPVLVHCTAGIGRTGTFVLVDVCLALLSLYRVVDIPTQLLELRTMRMGMVQTEQQLKFCYQAVMAGKKRLAVQTPAASPSMKLRPTSISVSAPDGASASSSSSTLPDPQLSASPEPGSPRPELLRQDGRSPSRIDVAPISSSPPDDAHSDKRQKTEESTLTTSHASKSDVSSGSSGKHVTVATLSSSGNDVPRPVPERVALNGETSDGSQQSR